MLNLDKKGTTCTHKSHPLAELICLTYQLIFTSIGITFIVKKIINNGFSLG